MAVINKNNKIDTINNVTKKSLYAVIYGRVSTASQDFDRQVAELQTYAERMGYIVYNVFCEKVSGAKKVDEREQLTELLKYVTNNHVDKVLIYECSRLSRRVVDFLTVIEHLTEQGISVIFTRTDLKRSNPMGNPTPLPSWYSGFLLNSTAWNAT